jgi:hypothetical protein
MRNTVILIQINFHIVFNNLGLTPEVAKAKLCIDPFLRFT